MDIKVNDIQVIQVNAVDKSDQGECLAQSEADAEKLLRSCISGLGGHLMG